MLLPRPPSQSELAACLPPAVPIGVIREEPSGDSLRSPALGAGVQVSRVRDLKVIWIWLLGGADAPGGALWARRPPGRPFLG
jgi:hypothetical protein